MKTRIKVISSEIRTDYYPQYKGWFGWHDMYGMDAPQFGRFMKILVTAPDRLQPLSLELAQYMIDKLLQQESEMAKIDKHKKEAKVSYVKYP